MSYRDFLDQQSRQFVKTTTRRKHLKAQINGETKMTQNDIKHLIDSKAQRMH